MFEGIEEGASNVTGILSECRVVGQIKSERENEMDRATKEVERTLG